MISKLPTSFWILSLKQRCVVLLWVLPTLAKVDITTAHCPLIDKTTSIVLYSGDATFKMLCKVVIELFSNKTFVSVDRLQISVLQSFLLMSILMFLLE